MMRLSGIILALLLCVQVSAQAPVTSANRPMNLHCTVDGSGKSTFCVQNAKAGSVVVERALWGRWVLFDTLGSLRAGQDTCITIDYQLHFGLNQLRFFIDDGVSSTYDIKSSSAKNTVNDSTFNCGNLPPQGLGEINLLRETYWELYNERGSLIKRGRTSSISKAGLSKGKYTLYYENCSMEFIVPE